MIVVVWGSSVIINGCPGPSVGMKRSVLSVVCGVLSSVHLVFPSGLGCPPVL